MTGTNEGPQAPPELELIRQFANTLDMEDGVDRLSTATEWAVWARSMNIDARATDGDNLEHARRLRDALRDALRANHNRAPLPAAAASALTDAAAWSDVRLTFDTTGPHLASTRDGLPGVVASVVAATANAMREGTWSRLKVCANDTCQWAFYDHSRSRTGRWCYMKLCGNRAKQARWRQQAT